MLHAPTVAQACMVLEMEKSRMLLLAFAGVLPQPQVTMGGSGSGGQGARGGGRVVGRQVRSIQGCRVMQGSMGFFRSRPRIAFFNAERARCM